MDATQVIVIIILTAAATVLLARNRQEQIKATYQRFEFTRKLITAFGVLLIAWTFLNSGDPVLMIVAIVGIVFATTYWYVEQPHERVV
jgi:uncharacterized membrane protein